jgi:hypothetical protein
MTGVCIQTNKVCLSLFALHVCFSRTRKLARLAGLMQRALVVSSVFRAVRRTCRIRRIGLRSLRMRRRRCERASSSSGKSNAHTLQRKSRPNENKEVRFIQLCIFLH